MSPESIGTLSNLDDEPSGRPEVFSRSRQLLRMSVMSSTWRSGRDICILDPSAYGFGNAPVSSGKLCAGVAKILLFGPHSACSLIQPKLFVSSISASSLSVLLLRY